MTADTAPGTGAKPLPSAFAPLRNRLFAVLWMATALGNVGTFMRDVASSWLVLELSGSPAMVALVQTAGTLPIFLLAIPAGVLSDIMDRRRMLIMIQIGLACVSLTLALQAATGMASVTSIVGLTFLGGVGAALMAPVWQSIVPELVPRTELKGAVALNSLGINIARAIGPAAGGAILTAFGAAATYGMDVASYAVVLLTLLWWKRRPDARDELSEQFGGALRAGLRYARASRELHRVFLRAGLFFAAASALWALLPIIAGRILGGGPGFYGLLLGAVGAGAIGGAVLLPRLRARLGQEGIMLAAALAIAAAMVLLALAPPRWAAVPILLVAGAAWIAVLTTLNATTQAILPNWVRGRGLALYLTVFNGALTAGSLAWGVLAEAIGVPATLWAGAVALLAVAAVVRRHHLPSGEADLTPSNHWPEPAVAEPVPGDRGPVLITIEYRVAAADHGAFLAVLHRLAEGRRRDGAYAWGASQDSGDPERVLEWFFVESWAEHQRQHRRVSHADADLQEETRAFHYGNAPPAVSHYLAFHRHGKPAS
ncbi:MFS transporter [Azospirillum doebereinerae]|uniref:MFS transporter n=2 Tax=Azospirillum doebereinerae TaxID=92933 RepID=UPI001EE52B65|nr:MFS transporter [Azospirillum doebereinerae]MCG5239420.1 MFS transporter [Azospirillum doebereinerae]